VNIIGLEDLKSRKILMLFIYAREIQEEEPMDNKKHWKRGNETYT
jgi:hypothetical protein